MAGSEGPGWYPGKPDPAGSQRWGARRAMRTEAPVVGSPHPRRPPWWVLVAGGAALLLCSGWVAAQPLPPSQPTPALQTLETQVQQEAGRMATLQSQAKQWQAQRAQVAAELQQEESNAAALTGQPAPPSVTRGLPPVNVNPPRITMSRGS